MDGYRLVFFCPPLANLLLQQEYLATITHPRRKSSVDFVHTLARHMDTFWMKNGDITHDLPIAPKKCSNQFCAILKHMRSALTDSYIHDCFGDESQWIVKITSTDDVREQISSQQIQTVKCFCVLLQSKSHIEYPIEMEIHGITYNLIQVITKTKHYCYHNDGWMVSNTNGGLALHSYISNVNVDHVVSPSAEMLMYLQS
jgi:hypothetical protein